ncbi:hypothetical protein EVAR_78636_1 [Eumeta japonica]|uniref:Uncharacterized protein n=1 Tax=Eumeta variegata TaxID=151549 RepID=A0A4C1U8M7_EUMVA|nr:hypothetical protein EVAR_78636_1 [Eumeta japonica]
MKSIDSHDASPRSAVGCATCANGQFVTKYLAGCENVSGGAAVAAVNIDRCSNSPLSAKAFSRTSESCGADGGNGTNYGKLETGPAGWAQSDSPTFFKTETKPTEAWRMYAVVYV